MVDCRRPLGVLLDFNQVPDRHRTRRPWAGPDCSRRFARACLIQFLTDASSFLPDHWRSPPMCQSNSASWRGSIATCWSGASAPAISIVSFLKIASEKDLEVFSHDQERPGPPMTCSR